MNSRLLPLLFALLKFGSGYLLASPVYELQRDEYLYLAHGQHLAWGYLEVPPLLAAQAALSNALGGGYFWVKFWPYLWGAATIYLVTRLVQRLGGGWFAVALAGTCYLGTAFARVNLLFQPNSFEVFGFVFCLYWLVCYFQNARPHYLYLLGLGLGLGLLNKYTTLFFIAALGGALLLTPARRLLLNRHFWGAAALGLLVWLPNLVWQIGHGLPLLHHMQLLKQTQLVNVEAAEFWKMQVLFCLGALWVWVPGLLALLAGQTFRPFRVVGWVPVLGVGLLAALHGKDYYALGYYPVLFVFGAVWWEQRLGSFRGKALLQPVLVVLPLSMLLVLGPFIYPLKSPEEMARIAPNYADLGLYRWEDGQQHALPQDYADMLGWQEMADKTWAAYQALPPALQANTLIHCANYGQSSAISYFNRHRAMPAAHSLNGSHMFWYPKVDSVEALIIIDDEPDNQLRPHFSRYYQAGQVENPYAREQGTRITVGLQPDSMVLNLLRREIKAAQADWRVLK